MKEVLESYPKKLQTYTHDSLIGFAESITINEILSTQDEMLCFAGYSFIQTKKEHDHTPVLPVNNYLKTAEEIEVEFLFMMNSSVVNQHEKENAWNKQSLSGKKKTETISTIHYPDNALSGSMEENY